ncbi:hypothetical protein [Streptomyces wuyuanensis]|uniref:hypothetical protein n=1 Tax=Streptomyces wuyuanensis TaxID=1196353 RepID=UPI0037AC2F64
MSAPVTVYVPRDSAARSVGADEVAERISAAAAAAGHPVRVVRNGSRGMLWLEPLVEVVTAAGRIAYGPVAPGDVEGLLDAGLLDGAAHALCLGPTEDIGWLRDQTRVTFARVGPAGGAGPLPPGGPVRWAARAAGPGARCVRLMRRGRRRVRAAGSRRAGRGFLARRA